MRYKQSTAVAISFGPFLDPTDGVTPVTGLVSAIDNGSTGIKLSKNGGALTIRHASVTASTYDTYGNYIVTLDTTDTNTLGTLRAQFSAPGSTVPVWADLEIVNANEWDSSFGTSVFKFADVKQWLTGTIPAPAVTGVPKVDLTYILGTLLTETAGLLAGGFKKFFNIASPAATMDHGVLVDTVTTVTTTTTATNLTNAPTAGDFTATMKTSLNAATPAVTVSDKTGFSLSTAGIQAIWDRLTSALTTAGSVGKLLVDNIDAAISSRMATYTQPTGFLAATFPSGTVANTTNITAGTITTATNVTTVNGLAANVVTAAALATDAVNEIADGLLGRNIAGGSSTGRTVSQALSPSRNKVAISGGVLTVYEQDGTTPQWDATVTTAAGNPLASISPST